MNFKILCYRQTSLPLYEFKFKLNYFKQFPPYIAPLANSFSNYYLLTQP